MEHATIGLNLRSLGSEISMYSDPYVFTVIFIFFGYVNF